ncbi:pseudouridine synthase, RluA family [Clostridium pasteurianum DSM 525 = ATCC 6013]|uniref:Pseudouridine synthase n=1 Tax=Clostridium pasteurianum DSM 525 = ATCC 6013 TaxID=1262449 RepID=A0A0H3J4J2_CLOPA|nr:RluA family pseudouridine synthase [Clostridium pasteurianum]AJA48399.1 pseudouridine synthase, RluA family [Clostridium pasteurianum DSM 525 = ATCC 6013]AJA52387.1 pseudouridine synthase, RluA family [Clostridium pasteurianum DSM 525 = ATCC 6013]AOZ75644.1 pseudouridylate synthase [Clostridium pasteurianum DSM 525 = ATCC 6013]AOZ79440.1 pseudouridylate synthase [Clostridium pasteurianum]ELP60451.1 ribosomal large subunit pseudouridine synthase D [Clostridium pasteurianum DSM 525 = ATCC 601
MNSKLTYYIENDDADIKIREYLKHKLNLSTRFIKKAAIEKRITVNDCAVKMNYVLRLKDRVEIDTFRKEEQDITPEKMDIDVIYEDQDLIVVNKPAGIVVHPTRSYPEGTLANGLLYYFKERGEKCIVRLVSRLDMDTSGLILIAKNQFSHMSLARDMKLDTFKKGYLAVVQGNLKEKYGTIDLPIYKQENNIRRVIDDRGQRSITHYEVVESFAQGELVKLQLETGRTHQIRVHLNSIGHPILGDTLYGGEDNNIIARQALHAYKLTFPHPRTDKIIELSTDLPEDIKNLIEILR